MAILRVRDENGNVIPVTAIKGDKGEAGAGVHVGSYVGDFVAKDDVNMAISRYIDLGSPNVKAVILIRNNTDFTWIDADGVSYETGEKAVSLITTLSPTYGNNKVLSLFSLAKDGIVYDFFNREGVTYHYIAFVEEVAE